MTYHPTFDATGYPSQETIERIEQWPHDDHAGLMEFVREAWYYPDRFGSRGRTYRLSTGGWSGNEEIILALQQNVMFWSMCWQSSRRGGHYVFRLMKLGKDKAFKLSSTLCGHGGCHE